MRRVLLLLVALGAAVTVVVAPARSPGPVGDEYLGVSSSVIACPELAVTEDSAAVLSGLVAVDRAVGASAPEPSRDDGSGAAALRRIDGETDLARIPAAGQPVNLLAATRSIAPILLMAGGSWAPTAMAGVATREIDGVGSGIASTTCVVPGPQWWFVGSGSQLGRGAALLVSNPAQEPARFAITLYAPSGPVEALAGKGIDLGPQQGVRLRLDALAEDQALLAVRVQATSGRVAAALRDVAVPEDDQPRGVDFIPPSIAPANRLWIGTVPGDAVEQTLVLVNPGSQFATVQPRLLTTSGPAQPAGLGPITVPARSVVSTPLASAIPDDGATVELTSDLPVTGAVQSAWGTGPREVSWLSATPAIEDPNTLAGAVAVPAGKGIEVSVSVTAPEGAVSGVLTVSGTGRARDSIFSETGELADRVRDDRSASRDVDVVTSESIALATIAVDVPAGQVRTISIPEAARSSILHLVWRTADGSGPAMVSHLALDRDVPLATGYSWWPTLSAVTGVRVREDVGVLAPAD